MKRKMLLTVILGILLLAGNSWADLITAGASYKVLDAEGGLPGGAFKIVTLDNSLITYTFCIERSETFSYEQIMIASNVSTQVINDTNRNETPGVLSEQAAYLFRKYITTYGIDGPDGSATEKASINEAYQAAIWRWENEGLPVGYPNTAFAIALYNEADSSALDNVWYGVRAVNWQTGTTQRQSHLVYDKNLDPVPEPVSMLLFGTGLFGIGGYFRKKFKK